MIESFSHQVRIAQIRDGDRVELSADEAERAAIARELGLEKIDRLDAHVALHRSGEAIRAKGRVTAALEQSCVVTREPVSAYIDEPFEIAFLPEPKVDSPEAEIELGAEDCDVVFHDGATIDIGAAVTDTLALSLDPYPRSASADAALKEAGVLNEEQAGPFAALAALKRSSDSE